MNVTLDEGIFPNYYEKYSSHMYTPPTEYYFEF